MIRFLPLSSARIPRFLPYFFRCCAKIRCTVRLLQFDFSTTSFRVLQVLLRCRRVFRRSSDSRWPRVMSETGKDEATEIHVLACAQAGNSNLGHTRYKIEDYPLTKNRLFDGYFMSYLAIEVAELRNLGI